MNVLVTGANGLLGQKLSKLISQDSGMHCIATSKESLKFNPGKCESDLLDITNPLQVKEIFDKYHPECVVHTAALTNVDACETDKAKCWETNVTATEHLLKEAAKRKAHFILLSTDFIFDGTHGPLTEEAEPKPVNYYGESKLAAEELVKNYPGTWTIARTVLVYGYNPGMSRTNIVLWAKESLESGKQITVVNDQFRTPTLAEDLAMGCYLIIKKKAEGVYNISGEEMMTPYDMAVKVAAHFKLDNALITKTDSTAFTQPAKRPLKTGFDISKAKRKLEYQPRTFEEGLALIAGQLREQA